MSKILLDPKTRLWTATELRRLPPEERDAILFAAAQLAESDYRHDESLTAFEAFDATTRHPYDAVPTQSSNATAAKLTLS